MASKNEDDAQRKIRQREYHRQWRAKNKNRVKQYKINYWERQAKLERLKKEEQNEQTNE